MPYSAQAIYLLPKYLKPVAYSIDISRSENNKYSLLTDLQYPKLYCYRCTRLAFLDLNNNLNKEFLSYKVSDLIIHPCIRCGINIGIPHFVSSASDIILINSTEEKILEKDKNNFFRLDNSYKSSYPYLIEIYLKGFFIGVIRLNKQFATMSNNPHSVKIYSNWAIPFLRGMINQRLKHHLEFLSNKNNIDKHLKDQNKNAQEQRQNLYLSNS